MSHSLRRGACAPPVVGAWLLASLVALGACSPQGGSPSGMAGKTGSAGSAGTVGAAGAMATAGTTGTSGATGTAGSGGAGATAGTGGDASGGITGAAGGAVAGAGGTTGTAGAASSGFAGSPGLTDPGTAGDGDFTIGPAYTIDPASKAAAGVPVGQQVAFKMLASESTIYATTARTQFMRNVWVYIPRQYAPGTPAPVIVVQDGNYACWWGNDVPHAVNTGNNLPGTANLPRILDNYIAQGKLPKMIAIFAEAGGGDGGNSQRGLEYDTVSGVYGQYVLEEMFPRVVSEVQKQLGIALKLTDDPEGHATLGGSSGGAGSFSMAWWNPNGFRRVITYSGTFVRQASPDNPLYPHGAWSYHDTDPYDAAAPNGLIVKEPTMHPLRMWLEVGTNDMGSGGGPGSYRDFELANRRMAASLKAKGYHYHFDVAQGGGHLDGGAVAQTLPSAMLWVWRGYPIN
jgi:enterochelin esterase family protein